MAIDSRPLHWPASPIASSTQTDTPLSSRETALPSSQIGPVKRKCAASVSYVGLDPQPDITGNPRNKRRLSEYGHAQYDPDFRAASGPQAPAVEQPSGVPTQRSRTVQTAPRPSGINVSQCAIDDSSDDEARPTAPRRRAWLSLYKDNLFLPDFNDSDASYDSDGPVAQRTARTGLSAAGCETPTVSRRLSSSVNDSEATRYGQLMRELAFSDAQKQVLIESIEEELAGPLAVMLDINPAMFQQEGTPSAAQASIRLATYFRTRVLPQAQGFEALVNTFRHFCTPVAELTPAAIPGRNARLQAGALKYVMEKLKLDARQAQVFKVYQQVPESADLLLQYSGRNAQRLTALCETNPALHTLLEAHPPIGAHIRKSNTLLSAVLANQARFEAILNNPQYVAQAEQNPLTLHARLHVSRISLSDSLLNEADAMEIDTEEAPELTLEPPVETDAMSSDAQPDTPNSEPLGSPLLPQAIVAQAQNPLSLFGSMRAIGPGASVAACLQHVSAASFPILSNPALVSSFLARQAQLSSLEVATFTRALEQELDAYSGLIEGMRAEGAALRAQQQQRATAARERQTQAALEERDAREQEERVRAQQQQRAAQARVLRLEAQRDEEDARRAEAELLAIWDAR